MWEQIAANRRRSAVLVAGMALILALVGYAGGELLAGPGAGGLGLLVALVVWGGMMIAYFTSAEDILMHGAYARELKREDSPQLFNIVEEMCLASGLGFTPRIYLIDDPAPNAFAVGRKPDSSAITVTTGLMYRLNRDELEGVIGHEVGHLKNRDVEFMTLAAVMLGSIVILSEIVRRSLWYGGRGRSRSDSRGGGEAQAIIVLVGLVFAILGPIMAQLLYFACSRKREYLADASSAQFTRYPEGLAAALEKISQAHVPLSFASQATAPMFIVNPLSAAGDEPDSVFASHPPTRERIRILRGMTGASFADYEAAYRRAKGGSLIGTGTLHSATPQNIRAPSTEGPIQTRQDTHHLAHRSFGYLRLHCNCGLDISVPEGYEQDTIRCVRCGSILTIPAAETAAPPPAAAGQTPAPPLIPLQYKRTGTGWESFRCACGRTIQLSPAFTAPQIRCSACGRTINVT
ncbi:MAG TPA: M48 family metallopeptidase [Verrucomicrobiae bacterium]|nr:M48 family metallopeptidase [Verrucomicrobiae bacterium]